MADKERALQELDEAFIRRELIGLVLGQARTAAAGNIGVAIAVTAVLSTSRARIGLWIWVASVLILASSRVLLSVSVMPRLPRLDRADLNKLERAVIASVGLTGLTWGLLPWIGYRGEDAFLDFFTIAMLLGVISGGTPSLAAIPRVLAVYLCTALLPTVLRTLYVGGTVSLAGGITVAFAAFVLWSFGRSTHVSLRNNLRLTFANTQLVDALRRERDAVQAAMRAKDLFQAGVTHDLRQPVHALALHLHYLRSLGPTADAADETVAGAWKAAETSLRVISGQLTRLLDLSRLESGEVQPIVASVPLETVLDACKSQVAASAADKGLTLRFRRTKAVVRSDVRMLQSIVDNFVSNAIRYTSTGGVLIGVRLRAEHAEIRVYDTGAGIAPQIIPQLFQPYRRFDDRVRGREEGHGLGLALVKKQADLLGHELTVRSIPDRGSLFYVTVPLESSARLTVGGGARCT